MQRVAEKERLFGGEEEVGRFVGAGAGASVGDEVGGAAYGVGDPAHQIGAFALARLAAEEGGYGGGVRGRGAVAPPSRDGLANRCQPVADQYGTGTSRAVPLAGRGMRRSSPSGRGEVVLPHPAAQQVLHGGRFGGGLRIGVVEGIGGEEPGIVGGGQTFVVDPRLLVRHRRRLGHQRAAVGDGVALGLVRVGCGSGIHGGLPWELVWWSGVSGTVRPRPGWRATALGVRGAARRRPGRRRAGRGRPRPVRR